MPDSPSNVENPNSPDLKSISDLKRLGLSIEDLIGKKVLDIGAGDRYMERQLRHMGIDAQIVSVDRNEEILRKKSTKMSTAAVAVAEILPFADNSFDLIMSNFGPLSGGPFDETKWDEWQEAVRTLKKGGEIRALGAFYGSGGVRQLLFELYTDGQIEIPNYFVENFLNRYEDVEVDEKGVPLEPNFWASAQRIFEKDIQKNLYNVCCDGLGQRFNSENVKVEIRLEEENPADEDYWPRIVVKKL